MNVSNSVTDGVRAAFSRTGPAARSSDQIYATGNFGRVYRKRLFTLPLSLLKNLFFCTFFAVLLLAIAPTSFASWWDNYFPIENNGEGGSDIVDLDRMIVRGSGYHWPEPPFGQWETLTGMGGNDGRMFEGNGGDGGTSQNPEAQPNDPNPNGCPKKGNPVLIGNGNKIESEVDFVASGEMPLSLTRTYNLHWSGNGLFGMQWTSNLDYRLTFGDRYTHNCYPRQGGGVCGIGSNTTIHAWRPDGRTITYLRNPQDGIFYEDKAIPVSRIVQQHDGRFVLYSEAHEIETYSAAGYISSVKNEQGVGWDYSYVNTTYPYRVTHTSGRYIEFYWDGTRLVAVRDPGDNYWGYAYIPDSFGGARHRLTATSRPGATTTTVTYHYEQHHFLTGKSFNGVRYSTFSYNESGYPVSTEHQGQDRYTFSYTYAQLGGIEPTRVF